MKIVRPVLISVGIMAVTAALLLAVLSFAFGKAGVLPQEMLPVLTTVIGCVAAFTGGLTAAAVSREKGILYGMACAGALLAVMAVYTLFSQNAEFQMSSIWKAAAILIAGSLGGIIGVNRKIKMKF